MKPTSIGVWMDHQHAFITPFTAEPMSTTTIHSKSLHTTGSSEHVKHHIDQNASKEFYKTLSGIIKEYERVLLFGPHQPKEELANMLKADHHFDSIKVDVKPAGKMSVNEQQAFVRTHFIKYA